MSYDKSKLFQGNQKANIKDSFCFSPAIKGDYDYKAGIMNEFQIGGVMNMKEPMQGQYASKKSAYGARMEQDEAETNSSY